MMLLAFPTLSVPASCEQLRDAVIMCSRRLALPGCFELSCVCDIPTQAVQTATLWEAEMRAPKREPPALTCCKPLERPGESSERLGCSNLVRWPNASSQGSVFTMHSPKSAYGHCKQPMQSYGALRPQSWAHPCPFG